MADPFESLRMPLTPTAPNPVFNARLRDRVVRALALPRGVPVSDVDLQPEPTPDAPSDASASVTGGGIRHGDIGYVSLWVPDVARAAAFFSAVLGWSCRGEEQHPQGRQIEGATPHHGMWGGQERSTLFLCFAVDDVASAVERVRAAGGSAEEPAEQPFGLASDCIDDDGTSFSLYQLPAERSGPRPPQNGARHGDLAYVTMEVRDSAASRRFYGTVLGWEFTPGRVEDGWGDPDVVPMMGMSGGHDLATTVPMYRVDDIEAAVARIRIAGGVASDPAQQPYGITSDCVDDQGTRFYLGQM
jgi:predicted enzyme related to lactoylglutathione lyase